MGSSEQLHVEMVGQRLSEVTGEVFGGSHGHWNAGGLDDAVSGQLDPRLGLGKDPALGAAPKVKVCGASEVLISWMGCGRCMTRSEMCERLAKVARDIQKDKMYMQLHLRIDICD